MFEQTFKNIDDVLRKEAGCASELDYTEQTSWLLFLKYLDDLEQERALKAEFEGKEYQFILAEPYRWSTWAKPQDKDKLLTGDDLIEFINEKSTAPDKSESLGLFNYLKGFKQRASSPDTIEYKIGEIFSEIKNKFQSGYNLREAIDYINELSFKSQAQKHELSDLYESRIKNMGNAGRNGGEYYTPRPLIRAMIAVIKPQLGEKIYDGACGSAGFLCEAYEYLRLGDFRISQGNNNTKENKLTTSQLEQLQTATFYGKEKKSLAYVIAIMNLILHGISAPNISHINTLAENVNDIQEKDRVDVVLANPPFGGKERNEIKNNFTIKTGETAFLFLQHFIKILKKGGRGAIVIKNTFLSNADNASRELRKELLTSCNLHTILDCPSGTFQGAGVKTVVLFFEKGKPTKKIWYYQLNLERNLGKTNPLNDDDLMEFVEFQQSFKQSEKSWVLDIDKVDKDSYDLSVKNANAPDEDPLRKPDEILAEIESLDEESTEILTNIKTMVS